MRRLSEGQVEAVHIVLCDEEHIIAAIAARMCESGLEEVVQADRLPYLLNPRLRMQQRGLRALTERWTGEAECPKLEHLQSRSAKHMGKLHGTFRNEPRSTLSLALAASFASDSVLPSFLLRSPRIRLMKSGSHQAAAVLRSP